MPQSLSQIYLHLVFSTKHRHPFLKNPAIKENCHTYIAGILNNQTAPALEVGGTADHIHALYPDLEKFSWQIGYSIFSVSASAVPQVTAYIKNQEQHHQTKSFQDEYRELLDKHQIEYDEKYLWD